MTSPTVLWAHTPSTLMEQLLLTEATYKDCLTKCVNSMQHDELTAMIASTRTRIDRLAERAGLVATEVGVPW